MFLTSFLQAAVVDTAVWMHFLDADKTAGEEARWTITQECCEQYWTSPGVNTPQGTNYTATYFPSRKLFRLDESDMQDMEKQGRAHKWCTPMDPTYGRAKAGRPARTYISCDVRIRDIALKTSQRRWTIGRSGERESGISVLAARHNDDDDLCRYRTYANLIHLSKF